MEGLSESTGSARHACERVWHWVNAGLGLVYPEWCQLCRKAPAGPRESYLCGTCRAAARFVERPFCERCGRPVQGEVTQSFECAACREANWAFSSARSAVLARDEVLEVIHRYKYQRALWFEGYLAQLLVQRAAPALGRDEWDWVVPVPLHPAKQREREFNQAERLARHLSKAMGTPLHATLLRRILPTESQTHLTRDRRLENVRKAFAMRKNHGLRGERIILVDDVFTTGATTGACAQVLRKAGAGEVCVWTVARGL